MVFFVFFFLPLGGAAVGGHHGRALAAFRIMTVLSISEPLLDESLDLSSRCYCIVISIQINRKHMNIKQILALGNDQIGLDLSHDHYSLCHVWNQDS